MKYKAIDKENKRIMYGSNLVTSPTGKQFFAVFSSPEKVGWLIPIVKDSAKMHIGAEDKNLNPIFDGDDIITESGDEGQVCWDEQYLQWFILFKDGSSDALDTGITSKSTKKF